MVQSVMKMPSLGKQYFTESHYRHLNKNRISRYYYKALFHRFLAQSGLSQKSASKLILSGQILQAFRNYVAIIGRRRREKPQKLPRKAGWRRGKMGQESSSPVDESVPPQTLQSRTVDGVAKYIKDGRAKRIVVMVSSCHYLKVGI